MTYRGKNIAEVLGMTVDAARRSSRRTSRRCRALDVLREVGLGYLRLGQPATELSGGEAQRIKLATELQRAGSRGDTLYVLDEPTTLGHGAATRAARSSRPALRPTSRRRKEARLRLPRAAARPTLKQFLRPVGR